MEPPLTTAEEAYQRLAPHYDELTREHEYDDWTRRLEDRALELGVSGRRLFDAACGTGKSFVPFLERGYSVSGCDISAAMVELASAKAPAADLFVGDIRELEPIGTFDLVTCLDDSLNYLIDDGDLEAAFCSLAANLAPHGVLVFDVNTLSTYRTTFASDMTLDGPDVFLAWRGRCEGDEEPGCVAELIIEAFSETEAGLYERIATRHLQRHHPREAVERALASAGLRAVAVHGLLPDGSLDTLADDDLHHKLVYFAHRVPEGGDPE